MLFEGRALEWMAEGGVAVVDINYEDDVFVWLWCACDVVHACVMAMCLWLFVLLVTQPAYRIVPLYVPLCVFLCRYDILGLFGFVCSKSRQEFLQ